jgi:hypothetical protein
MKIHKDMRYINTIADQHADVEMLNATDRRNQGTQTGLHKIRTAVDTTG